MRIAIISTMRGYTWAGTEEVWYQFAKKAMAAGHSVILGADEKVLSAEPVKELEENGMQVVGRRIFKPMRLYLAKQRFLPDMRSIARFDPDVLLLNAGSPLDHIYASWIWQFCRELDCPKVFFCHFNSDRLKIPDREQLLATLKEMRGMIFVSEDNRKVLERQIAHHFENAIVVRNGPRLKIEHPLEWPESDMHLVQVARLETEWKGQEVLLETMAQDKWRERNWKLTLYGSGPDEDYIKRLISFYGLEEKVSMGGYVRDMVDIYKSGHLLVLPSKGEGTPLAALEAMMCGRPVLATDVGGNSEIIKDGYTGFIAEAPTVNSISNALERAWENKSNWREMGKRAHEKALELYENDPAGKVLGYLESIL